jgi:23S rRNA (uracil1939-C5)-methyltransferase
MGRRKSLADRPIETATISDLTADGRGIAKVDGKAVFIDAAITGEVVSYRRIRTRRSFDEAELIEVHEPSSERVEAPCEYFSICGGCSLQHLESQTQLRVKQEALLQALERIGGLAPETVLPPLTGRSLGYRRRARLGVKYVDKKGRVLVGFREKRKPYVADMRSCEVLSPKLGLLIVPLQELIESLSINRKVPQIEMSMGDDSLALIFRVLDSPTSADRVLLSEFAERFEATIWLQTGGPDSLELLDPRTAAAPLWYELPEFGLRLEFGPLDFIQVNQDMNQRMISQALDLVGPLEGKRVMDLFCGIGNFSLPLARSCGTLVGVELAPAMVEKARANAIANDIVNAEFVAADLTCADALPAQLDGGFDLVVLDPPRAGAQEVLEKLAATGTPRILYVSCHPGSLARDASILAERYGFTLKSAGAIDIFPHTSHVEAMALFER